MTWHEFGLRSAAEILTDKRKSRAERIEFAETLMLLGAIVYDALLDAPKGSLIVLKRPDGTERVLTGSKIVRVDDLKPYPPSST